MTSGCNNRFYQYPPLWHKLSAPETTQATCTTSEIIRQTCTRTGCSHFEEEEGQSELGHDPNDYGVCKVIECGYLVNSTTGMFEHYMYRGEEEFARHISTGWLGYNNHHAIDINDNKDFPIYAQGPGTVIARSEDEYDNAYGHFITIRYDNGLQARYAHLKTRPPIPVNAGDASRVTHETPIGITYNTGGEYDDEHGPVYGYHLHFELRTWTMQNDGSIVLGSLIPPPSKFPRCSCPTNSKCIDSAHDSINTFSGNNRSS